jgi:hypothetical protein
MLVVPDRICKEVIHMRTNISQGVGTAEALRKHPGMERPVEALLI